MELNKMGYFNSKEKPRQTSDKYILRCLAFVSGKSQVDLQSIQDFKSALDYDQNDGADYEKLCDYLVEIFQNIAKVGSFGETTVVQGMADSARETAVRKSAQTKKFNKLTIWRQKYNGAGAVTSFATDALRLAAFLADVTDENPTQDTIVYLKESLDKPSAGRDKSFTALLKEIKNAEGFKLPGRIGHSTHAIVDDNSFIQLVANGHIPIQRTFIDDHNIEPVQAIRAFLCAKCVYMAYLYAEYRKAQKKTIKLFEREKKQLKSKRRSYKSANLNVELGPTPLMQILISKKAMLSRVLNEIEESYKKTIDSDRTTLSTPYLLWKQIKMKPSSPSSVKDENKNKIKVSFSVEKELYEVKTGLTQATSDFTNLTTNYQELVLSQKGTITGLHFTDDQLNKTKYELCIGAKNMIDAGVEPQVRYKFYRMATSFAIAPFTMFKTMAMNIALMGPPGTGKSTLAKKIGAFAHAVGWLTSDETMEPLPSELISDVRGETATNTRSYLNASLGRMLFIDEAYALTPKGDPSGKEFADELTEFLTNHKGMLMVMVAGYVDEMTNDFFSANIGLPRRFPTRIILGKKTARACFNAFMLQLTNKMGKDNIGALNILSIKQSQVPFFLSQAAIWIPIFHILLGERFKDNMERDDDDVNLLNYYYADIELIAEIYIRYLMSEGLFGVSDGINKGTYNYQETFSNENVVKNVLNDWLNCKGSENTRVEGIRIPISYVDFSEGPLTNIDRLDVFKDYYDSKGAEKAKEAFKEAQSLLEERICLWPLEMGGTGPSYRGLQLGSEVAISFEAVDPDGGEKASNASYKWLNTAKEICGALGGQNVNASALHDYHKHTLEIERIEKKHKEEQERLRKEIEEAVRNSGIPFNKSLNDEQNIDALKDILDKIRTVKNIESTKEEKLRKEVDTLKARNKELKKMSELPLPYNSHSSVVNIYTTEIKKAKEEQKAAVQAANEAKAETITANDQLEQVNKELADKLIKVKSLKEFNDKLEKMKQKHAFEKANYTQHIRRAGQSRKLQMAREIFDDLDANQDDKVTFDEILDKIFKSPHEAKKMINKLNFDGKTKKLMSKEIDAIKEEEEKKRREKIALVLIKKNIKDDPNKGKTLKEKFNAIDVDENDQNIEWKEVEHYMGKKPIVKNRTLEIEKSQMFNPQLQKKPNLQKKHTLKF